MYTYTAWLQLFRLPATPRHGSRHLSHLKEFEWGRVGKARQGMSHTLTPLSGASLQRLECDGNGGSDGLQLSMCCATCGTPLDATPGA